MAYRGSWPLTVKGHSGSRVYALQYLLKYRGYSPGTVDGKFGTNTYNAARNFQRSRGLVVDGKVGTNTWSKLIATFRKGSSNNAVRAIQYLLRYRYGYTAVGNVDGIYGTKTYDCAKSFQGKAGISADGVVGQNTWRYLLGSDAIPSFSRNSIGVANYAYYRVGDTKYTFYDDVDIKNSSITSGGGYPTNGSLWCSLFVHHCAKKVGYSYSSSKKFAPKDGSVVAEVRTSPYKSDFKKGYTFITTRNASHWGIIWQNSGNTLYTIEANSSYNNGYSKVQKVPYRWSGNKWVRYDGISSIYGYINTSKY